MVGHDGTERAAQVADDDAEQRGKSVQVMFMDFRSELDDFNDRRERLIKASRDVTTMSKRLIFHLHRLSPEYVFKAVDASQTNKLVKEAHVKQAEIVSLIRNVAKQEQLDDRASGKAQRFDRAFGPGLEEFIEAVSFFYFLQHGRLITHDQVQELFVDNGKITLPITPQRYLLGISDLTGELMRFATNALGASGNSSQTVVSTILTILRDLTSSMDPFVPLIYDFRSKQRVTNQSMRKIEDLSYAVKVRSSEYGSDPEALREMVKRALAGNNTSLEKSDDLDRSSQ